MKKLNQLLSQVPHQVVKGSTDISVSGITADSRVVTEDSVFVAIKGVQTDGHRYIQNAISKGATCIFCEYSVQKFQIIFVLSKLKMLRFVLVG